MSARSSVTRQCSQESDANNNFGSLPNGQAVFVTPIMQQGGSSYPQSGYSQVPPAQFQPRSMQPGGNPGYAAQRQHQPRGNAMGASAQTYPSSLPVIEGQYLVRHVGPGAVPTYTVGLGVAGAAPIPPQYQSTQFAQDMTSGPPPNSAYFPAAVFAHNVYGPTYAMNPTFPPQTLFMNGQAQPIYFPQQQQTPGPGNFIAQPGHADFQLAPATPTSVQSSNVPQSSAPVMTGAPPETFQQVPNQPAQPVPTPQSTQQPPIRRKCMLEIIDPNTKENVLDSVIKEKEEVDRHRHQNFVGGLWKPPPDAQKQQIPVENADRRPSRDQTPVPGADSQSEPSQAALNLYTAVIDAAAGDKKFDSPPPTSADQQHKYSSQSEHVILPPATGGYNDSSPQLQFGVDDALPQAKATTPSNVQSKDTAKPRVQFGWDAEDEKAKLADSRSVSKSPAPPENAAPSYEQSTVIDPTVQSMVPQDKASMLDSSQSADEEAEVPSATTRVPQMQIESAADESEMDGASARDDGSKYDDSMLDQSMVSSVDERSTETGRTEEADELAAIKEQLERFADDIAKKKYNQDFMLLAQKLPASKAKPQFNTTDWRPENIDDVFNLRKRHTSQTKGGAAKFTPLPGAGQAADFTTTWMKVPSAGPPTGRKQYPGRSSDNTGARRGRGQISRGSQKQPPMILGAPAADVELKHTENAWKPNVKKIVLADDPEKAETEKLFKEVRGILNKITPQTLEELAQEFLNLESRMNTADRASGVVDVVFQKAVDEPKFCQLYSDLYDRMTRNQLAKQQAASGGLTKSSSTALNRETNFRYILLTKCQTEFENVKKVDAWKKEREAAIAAAETPEEKKRLQDEMDETWSKAKRQMLGNMRFIGELYLRNMLTAKIMHHCVSILSNKSASDEEALECLCNLLSTIGKKLESDKAQEFPGSMDHYLKRLDELSRAQLPRYKFMVLDLLDLRKNGWIPRRKGEGPKTIDQIHQEAHMEKLNEQILVEQHELNKQMMAEDSPTRGSQRGRRKPDLPSRGSYGTPDRHDHDGRGTRASMGREQGRQHGGGSQQLHVTESSSKFTKQPSLSQHLDPSTMKLGPQRSWAKGAGVSSSPSAPAMSATLPRPAQQETFKLQNKFDALGSEYRRGSVGSASSSRESSQTRMDDGKRSAMEAARQFTMGGGSATIPKPAERRDTAEAAPRDESIGETTPIDDNKLRNYTRDLIDELEASNEFGEALNLIQEKKSATDRIIAHALSHVMEKKDRHRIVLGDLISRLYAANGRAVDITNGFALFVRNSIEEDLAQDVPQMWAYVGQVLAVVLSSNQSTKATGQRLMLNEFRDAFREAGDSAAAELLAQTLLAVRKSSTDEKITELYQSITDRSLFVTDKAVETAFRKHSLDFLLNSPFSATSIGSTLPGSRSELDEKRANVRVQIPPPSSAATTFPYGLASPGAHSAMLREPLDPDVVELERLVQATDEKLAVDQLVDFIKNTKRLSDESERSLAFLGALVRSLCSKIVVSGEIDDSYDVDQDELENSCMVLQSFVTSRREFEKRTLDVLADHYYNLNCPQGLLVKIFAHLHKRGVIETECFSEWWMKDHGVISSNGELKAFFTQFVDITSDPDPGSESEQEN